MQPIVKNPDGTYTITKEKLEELTIASESANAATAKADEYLSDLFLLHDRIMVLLSTFQLTTPDKKNIKPEIINKTEKPMKYLLKGAMNAVKLMTLAPVSSDAQKELDETYSFLDELVPVLLKYTEIRDKLLKLKS